MLSLLKRYRTLLIVGVLLLYPLGAFLTTGRRGRTPNFLDRVVIGVTAPLAARTDWPHRRGQGRGVRLHRLARGARRRTRSCARRTCSLRAAVQALGETRAENERLRGLLGYAQAASGPEITARVVGVNPVAKLLSVRINRGETDGVFRGMSVVTPDGIVGQVVRTTGGWADVALVTDVQSRVAVRVQRSRARGTAAGAGKGPLRLENDAAHRGHPGGRPRHHLRHGRRVPAGAGGGEGDAPGEDGAWHVPGRRHRPRGGHHPAGGGARGGQPLRQRWRRLRLEESAR